MRKNDHSGSATHPIYRRIAKKFRSNRSKTAAISSADP
jgi:hypothetical protein